MTRYDDQLREAFASHEHLAPDAEGVLTGSQGLARRYRRRRRAAQAAGGTALGVGLVTGVVGLSGVLPDRGAPADVVRVPSAGFAAGATYTDEQRYDAFARAGYDYDDAVALAAIFQTSETAAKVLSGQKLLDGEPLPIAPGSAAPAPATAADSDVDAFFAAGYDYVDAQQLARLWKTSDAYSAKVLAGQKLRAGQELPFAP